MSSQASANTASSAVDDFDKLIMEFTGEDMPDDAVDDDVNEDDLLQELSEMIEIDGWETPLMSPAVLWRNVVRNDKKSLFS